MKTITNIIQTAFASFVLAWVAALPDTQAVVPPPDGGYPGFNTAEGQNALFSLTTGSANTALGWYSLFSDAQGSFNTATGTGSLLFNTADQNTAFGAAALLSNTTGFNNTAVGAVALLNNIEGANNTATGSNALYTNTTGFANVANGAFALGSNSTGYNNTAYGYEALFSNTTAPYNTAVGSGALVSNTTGSAGTAVGRRALVNNTTGSNNIALGSNAGQNLTTGDNNIDIGNGGVADEANTIRIGDPAFQTATFVAGIRGTAVIGDAVVVDANGQLGTATSSARFKKEIKPMDKTSEAILALKPVRFQYKSDSKGTAQFGLIAEEVAKVNPTLVVRDRNGEIYSVRYEAVNAMLLNEFLKAHQRIEEQEHTIAQLKSGMEALTATMKEQGSQIQKVSAQIEVNKRAPQVVDNQLR
jgi:hypothetical protein